MQYRHLLMGLIALGFAGAAQAGMASIQNEGGISQLEYRGAQYLRMATDAEGYMLHRDGRLYMVQGRPGQETVMDAGAMLGMFRGAMPDPGPQPQRIESLKPTGASETVAGISGEVWSLRYVDDQGRQQQADLVLSKDARVRELSEAFNGFSLTLMRLSGQDTAPLERMTAELKKTGRGMLRYGSEMKVTYLSGDAIASSRFDLPAEPMAMPDFSGLAGRGGQPAATNGGSAAGEYVGEKAQRQQSRVEDRTEQEVDNATDRAVDKVLNKAFDKLFGN